MRFSVVISVALALCGLTGCPIRSADETGFGADPGGDDDNGVGSGAPQSACASDLDCELASSSCCECPSFATSRGDPSNDACTGIACPNPPTCPANVRAACNLQKHQCEVACVEMACANSCPDGYAIDPATGCLSCQCALPAAMGCSVDADCVQTREDCCGCARGGKDTAVLGSAATAYDQMLSCPSNPQCPGLDTCDAAAEPRCVQGACVLTDALLPANACAQEGSCASGTCIINRDPDASALGVGVCVPQ
ncbi:MAG: hypothetical protein AB7T06_16475 [Kofleriaceae bacterium]